LREQKSGGENGANYIGHDHDAPAVRAVNDDAGDGAEEEQRQVARDGIDGDGASLMGGSGEFEREGEHGDVVEAIADLGDNLPPPEMAKIRVPLEQLLGRTHYK